VGVLLAINHLANSLRIKPRRFLAVHGLNLSRISRLDLLKISALWHKCATFKEVLWVDTPFAYP